MCRTTENHHLLTAERVRLYQALQEGEDVSGEEACFGVIRVSGLNFTLTTCLVSVHLESVHQISHCHMISDALLCPSSFHQRRSYQSCFFNEPRSRDIRLL